jgi:hypothetical protein
VLKGGFVNIIMNKLSHGQMKVKMKCEVYPRHPPIPYDPEVRANSSE